MFAETRRWSVKSLTAELMMRLGHHVPTKHLIRLGGNEYQCATYAVTSSRWFGLLAVRLPSLWPGMARLKVDPMYAM